MQGPAFLSEKRSSAVFDAFPRKAPATLSGCNPKPDRVNIYA
jgi:hypothetical protein